MRPENSTAVKCAGIAAAMLFLSACENPYLKQFREEFGWTEARMVSDGWLKGRNLPLEPSYCYETLAQTDCYRSPRKDQEHRSIGRRESGSF